MSDNVSRRNVLSEVDSIEGNTPFTSLRWSSRIPKKFKFDDEWITVDNIDHDYYARTVFAEPDTPEKRFKRNEIDLFKPVDCTLAAVQIDQPSTSSEGVKRRSFKRNTNDKVSAPNALDIHVQLCSESLENMVVTVLDKFSRWIFENNGFVEHDTVRYAPQRYVI